MAIDPRNKEATLVAAFRDPQRASEAVHALDAAGFPPDHVGLVSGNVRQAREAAGAFSRQGAIAGAVLGALVAVAFVVFGPATMRVNPVALALGAPTLVVAFAAIGALVGRAKLLRPRRYERYERIVEMGDALVTVSGPPGELARARTFLERHGATAIRREDTNEAV